LPIGREAAYTTGADRPTPSDHQYFQVKRLEENLCGTCKSLKAVIDHFVKTPTVRSAFGVMPLVYKINLGNGRTIQQKRGGLPML
jgi:hypothetical protein